MRLGGPIYYEGHNPDHWIMAVRQEGYRSLVFPLGFDEDDSMINAYHQTAIQNDIVIAEVGAWSNPLSPDKIQRKLAIEYCQNQLDLAERIRANCCVNIAGSRGDQWDGPHQDNFSQDTFELMVDTVREIIDAVKPKHTFFSLETMPWIFPDSAESYLDLLNAIDRPAFAVHFDPVNLITSPRAFYTNGHMIKEFISLLGPYIKSSHAKDIQLSGEFMVHLKEVMPGTGVLNYKVLLHLLHSLNPDMPLILEHLSDENEYRQAARFIRKIAAKENIPL